MGDQAQGVGSAFAQLLQFYRTRAHLTQVQLAERIPVSAVLISYYERGRRYPRMKTAIRIAEVLALDGEDRENLLSSLQLPGGGVPDASAVLDELVRIFGSSRVAAELKAKLAGDVRDAIEVWKALQQKKVRWAVIPVAGWQARLLAMKATAQLIQRTIIEAQRCGIERSIIIVAPNQQEALAQKLAALDHGAGLLRQRKIRLVVQGEQLGLGHALLAAKGSLPDNEPFALVLPDDGVEDSCLASMLKLYDEHKCCVLAVRKLKRWDEESYGIVSFGERRGNICTITALTEKPEVRPAEASLAILGRYILTPEIFKVLEATSPNPRSGHLELTDALDLLARQQTVYGYSYAGKVHSISPSRRQLAEQLEAFMSA